MSFGDHEMMAKQPILACFVEDIGSPLWHDTNHEALSCWLNGDLTKNLRFLEP
jgi:hypothetical protein